MFHNSTTLHHRYSEFSAPVRENRLVHANWFATKKLQSAVVWDYMRGPRKLARLYSWSFGWPLITKGADLTVKGLGKAVDGMEWTSYTIAEGAKGTYEMAAKPLLRLGWSRIVALKRFLWDVPIATVSAAIRTPIAIAKSPLEMVGGVRDAIKSVPRNAMEIFNSIREFKLMDTLRNTRRAITDVILPPITRPLAPILSPVADIAGTAIGAEMQTVSAAKEGITGDIPGGFRRIMSAPSTASAILAQKLAVRAAAKAVIQKEKLEKKEALKAAVAADKGEAPANGGGMKKAA